MYDLRGNRQNLGPIAVFVFLLSGCVGKSLSPPSAIFAEPINVFFGLDNSSLDQEAQSLVRAAVMRGAKFDCGKLLVTGNTDNPAFEREADQLSMMRADAVKKELVRDGYKGSIATEGRGYRDPFKTNNSDQPEPLNRRVQISFGCRVS